MMNQGNAKRGSVVQAEADQTGQRLADQLRSSARAREASATRPRVLQRMEGTPRNDPPQKDPWRHLETAPTQRDWPHKGNVVPSIQIAVARHVVTLLRSKHIVARLGGSVATLGYSTTRVPDDIDIDIWPKAKHVGVAKDELVEAAKFICQLTGREFPLLTVDDSWGIYRIDSFEVPPFSDYVITVLIHGTVVRNRHNPDTYEIEIHQEGLTLKLQIVNETAFTFMHRTKDPGTVAVEKYKEVTGLARLVANCVSRYLDAPNSRKSDRDRIKQMFKAKLLSAEYSKIERVCVKILHYFDKEDDRRQAAELLGEVVHEMKPAIDARALSKAALESITWTINLTQFLQSEAIQNLLKNTNQ